MPETRARSCLVLALLLAVAAVLTGGLGAGPAASATPPGSLLVSGNVTRERTLSVADLAALPGQQTVTAVFTAGGVSETHVFTGPLLRDVIALAGLRTDPATKNDKLRDYVAVTASDGYQALLAYGELDPQFEGKQLLLAVTQDGASLAGPGARLVVPGDTAGGRYVSGVVAVTVTTPAVASAAAAAGAAAPLQAQVTVLTGTLRARDTALAAAAADSAAKDSQIAALQGAGRPLVVLAPSTTTARAAFSRTGLPVSVSGPTGRTTTVRLQLDAPTTRRLGLTSPVLATGTVTDPAQGAAALVLHTTPAGTRALARLRGRVRVEVVATAGDRTAATATLLGAP